MFKKSKKMELLIENSTAIGEIQHEFQQFFPFLKPVFFDKKHAAYQGSPSEFLISDTNKTMGEIRTNGREGVLFLELEMPVWQIERLFEEDFGLHVQIFRKSGSKWLETSFTDNLNLETQNANGEAAEDFVLPIVDPMDYGDRSDR